MLGSIFNVVNNVAKWTQLAGGLGTLACGIGNFVVQEKQIEELKKGEEADVEKIEKLNKISKINTIAGYGLTGLTLMSSGVTLAAEAKINANTKVTPVTTENVNTSI